MTRLVRMMALAGLLMALAACTTPDDKNAQANADAATANASQAGALDEKKANMYTSFTLTTDTSALTDNQKKMIPILIQVAEIMDDLFWREAYNGDKDAFLDGLTDPATRKFAEINYGPWDRLDDNKPFLEGVGPKPLGAGFYPEDVTKQEISDGDQALRSLYTLVRRNDDGSLEAVPYHVAFADEVKKAADLMKQAAALAEDEGFKNYLELRAEALLTDEYYESDLAWMEMKDNTIDFVVGPIEVYEDKLFNYKAAHEAYILVKDKEWSRRLAHYAALLPDLQRGLPVDDAYKKEMPGSKSDLNAYDVIYYAGDCNAGSKTIAINLPNDERVHAKAGSRRLQLKNAMKAKFDKILVPIADELIVSDQRQHITFDAFFANTMFHEVAHGLGINQTINGKGTVREALKDLGSAMEEGKADILGLYMISSLLESGELEGNINDYYVTFITGIFRSVRFGAASAHGKANMIRFNYFQKMGAFVRDENGHYRVVFDKMGEAMEALSRDILMLQGDGDYEGVTKLFAEMGNIDDQLQADLDRLADAGIPTDIVFDQGLSQLNL